MDDLGAHSNTTSGAEGTITAVAVDDSSGGAAALGAEPFDFDGAFALMDGQLAVRPSLLEDNGVQVIQASASSSTHNRHKLMYRERERERDGLTGTRASSLHM